MSRKWRYGPYSYQGSHTARLFSKTNLLGTLPTLVGLGACTWCRSENRPLCRRTLQPSGEVWVYMVRREGVVPKCRRRLNRYREYMITQGQSNVYCLFDVTVKTIFGDFLLHHAQSNSNSKTSIISRFKTNSEAKHSNPLHVTNSS